MSDRLSQFPGPYSKKVEALMKKARDHVKVKPADELTFSHCLNQRDMLNYYDYDAGRYKRRLGVTLDSVKTVKEKLKEHGSPKEIENNFALGNSMLFRGGYNVIDSDHKMTLAVAIWILDQLSLQGNLEEIYQYLPEISESEFTCLYVAHPEYDFDLIAAVVQLLLSRNDQDYHSYKYYESTFYSDRKVAKKNESSEIRRKFDAVIDLLDPETVRRAVTAYETAVWDFYRASFSAIIRLQREEDRLNKELQNFEADSRNLMIPSQPGPFAMPKKTNELPLLSFHGNERLEQKRIVEDQLDALINTGYFTEISLPNSREKIVNKFKYIIGKERAENLISFSVDDPFEMAFALFYLLDIDSNIPWLYYGSVSVAYTLADQLPFDTAKAASGKITSTSELNNVLYQHRYEGYRWENQTDCLGEAIERKYAKNLSQIIYSNTFALFPRVTYSLPTFDNLIENLDIKDEKTAEPYRMMLYLLNSQHFRSESLQTYRLRATESESQNEEGKEVESPNDPLVDEKLINILRKQNASMRAAPHEETVLRKENVRQLRSLESENEKNRRELADLRSLLLTLQTEHAPHELEIKETIEFPIHLESKIVSQTSHLDSTVFERKIPL